MRKTLIIFLFFLFSVELKAFMAGADSPKNCPTVPSMSKQMGPIRNQEDLGWCYAFVAADLVGYKLKKNISAADIAVVYNAAHPDYGLQDLTYWIQGLANPKPLSGGFVASAYSASIDHGGFCTEDIIKSEAFSGDSTKKVFSALITYLNKENLSEANRLMAQKIFPKAPNLLKLEKVEGTIAYQMKELTKLACKGKRIIPNSKPVQFDMDADNLSAQTLVNTVDRELSIKNPVGFTYELRSIKNKSSNPSIWSTEVIHESIITGRFYNKKIKACVYEVRNSWGPNGCKTFKYPKSCRKGYYWITRNQLRNMIRRIEYLQN